MRRMVVAFATAVALVVPATVGFAADAKKADEKMAEGKSLFLKNGCQTCHAIASQEIERKSAAASKAEPAAASTAKKPPDLSGVGLEHDAAWMAQYLQKKTEMNGKKHMKLFKGTADQLSVLTAWLADLKTAPADSKSTAPAEAVKEAKEAKEEAKEAKQEAKEAKQDAKEALDEAKEAKEEAQEAKEEAKDK